MSLEQRRGTRKPKPVRRKYYALVVLNMKMLVEGLALPTILYLSGGIDCEYLLNAQEHGDQEKAKEEEPDKLRATTRKVVKKVLDKAKKEVERIALERSMMVDQDVYEEEDEDGEVQGVDNEAEHEGQGEVPGKREREGEDGERGQKRTRLNNPIAQKRRRRRLPKKRSVACVM